MSAESGIFPVLLKLLSDASEEVVKRDLQLLAQMASHSSKDYFRKIISSLLELFATDRRLLEARGSLIVRELCLHLHPERIYRTFAEILEKEEDKEFAGTMVQNLNLILVTASELVEMRLRLRKLDTEVGVFVLGGVAAVGESLTDMYH